MKAYVYMIKNKVNNKKYIGKTEQKIFSRWSDHKRSLERNDHTNNHLQHSWNKYGKDSFEFLEIVRCKIKDVVKNEQFFIDIWKTMDNENGYNIRPADRREVNEEMRQKWIENLPEPKTGEDHWAYGTTHSQETIDKIQRNRPNMEGENNPYYGKTHSEETKELISQNHADFSGENHPQAKLSREDVSEIKYKLNNTDLYQEEIGEQYGIDQTVVSKINVEKIWQDVKPKTD